MSSLGVIFTQFSSWMTDMVGTITKSGNEILLLAVGIFAVGAVIGLARRLIGG